MSADKLSVRPGSSPTVLDSAGAEAVDAKGAGNVNINRFEMSDRTLSILALIAGVLALGMIMVCLVVLPMYVNARVDSLPVVIDAKVQAGAADAKAIANAARVDARVSLDEVERLRAHLYAKGIVVPKAEH